jgi:hypothetical protein
MMTTKLAPAALALFLAAVAACSSTGSSGGAAPDTTDSGSTLGMDAGGHPTGEGGALHSVTLSWSASSTAGVTYTVLRSTASGSGYSSQISGLTALTWTDTAVMPGVTYYYVVDDSLGSSTSTYSNQATASIP